MAAEKRFSMKASKFTENQIAFNAQQPNDHSAHIDPGVYGARPKRFMSGSAFVSAARQASVNVALFFLMHS